MDLPGPCRVRFHRLCQLTHLGLDRGDPALSSEMHLANNQQDLLRKPLPHEVLNACPRLRGVVLLLLLSWFACARPPSPIRGRQKPAVELPGQTIAVCEAAEFQLPLLLRLQVVAEGKRMDAASCFRC